ncbi:MAG TPA: PEP/pyruvate-binding domain-containing protein [Dissulfurispiraceae bacterium]|nr:PEP/pyruvate-binding domain-containing protein [Dissulfurispiraceae bacterium]
MKILDYIKFMFGMDHAKGEKRDTAAPLRQRFAAFRKLLDHNNTALAAMADLGEKLTGDYLFDRRYVETKTAEVADNVGAMIENLNVVCHGNYSRLADCHKDIAAAINQIVGRRQVLAEDVLTIPLAEIAKETADRVGGKMANLGEMLCRAAIPVPEGFAVTAYAFRRFLDHNDLPGKIAAKLDASMENNLAALEEASASIQEMVRNAKLPEDLAGAIAAAYRCLEQSVGGPVTVSVRSSALQEDGAFSFAGQYSSVLNVAGPDIADRYKDVLASLFNQRALFYWKTKGFQDFDMAMPVGILRMVDAKAGGVMYSRDPNNPKDDTIIISAVHGLGACVVDGTVSPETHLFSRSTGKHTTLQNAVQQQTVVVCAPAGGIEKRPLTPHEARCPCINVGQIAQLAAYADKLELHYGCPQDIEWAIDIDDKPILLQSRPLHIHARETKKSVPTRIAGYEIKLSRGVIACKGIGFGPVHYVRLHEHEDLNTFPDGGVLVAKHTSTKFVTVMDRASAIITDVGSTTGHMASLAREYQVPTILDAETATSTLKQGELVTVDAVNGNVYAGTVEELREFANPKEDPFKSTQLFRSLEKALKHITPLNLIDPEDPGFRPEACRTLHDITRFCHEMAVRELFNIEYISADDVGSQKLVAAIPTEIWVLDLGGAIEGTPHHLNIDHVRCLPFLALFKGLTSMRWPEAKKFDVSGFMGAIAHTATTNEEQLRRAAEKSFAILTNEYMTFAVRLGYHLSTIEAFAGESINDNYIRFFFKGGGAAIDRRLRRVRLIAEILKHMDFNVKTTDDVVEASLMKYKKETIQEKLEIMGKFTVFTKQLDMVMYNDAITNGYIAQFIKQHITAKTPESAAAH